MKIRVNGEVMQVEEGITVEKLLEKLGIKEKTMAAAIDMQVIKKDQWCKRVIQQDEKVEFLHFVGGG